MGNLKKNDYFLWFQNFDQTLPKQSPMQSVIFNKGEDELGFIYLSAHFDTNKKSV